MAERKLYIFIAAVSTFAFLHIQGQGVTCKNPSFVQVGGACYKIIEDFQSWTNARDTCKSLNGKLATFTSADQMAEFFNAQGIPLGEIFWVGTPNEAQETGDYWIANWETNLIGLHVYLKICLHIDNFFFKSVCMENDNNLPVNNSTLSNTPPKQKETCSFLDSFAIDGQCYKLSSESLAWKDANKYCESLNRKLATISSLELGIRLLQFAANGTSFKAFWATDPFNNGTSNFFDLRYDTSCTQYTYGQSLYDSEMYQVLCME